MISQEHREFLVNHIVDRLTDFLVVDKGVGIADALQSIYKSGTYHRLQDIEGELYVQSPAYVYEELLKELS